MKQFWRCRQLSSLFYSIQGKNYRNIKETFFAISLMCLECIWRSRFNYSLNRFLNSLRPFTLSFDKLISEEKFQVGKKTWMKQSLPSKQLEQSSSKQESVSRSTGSWKGGGGRRRREEADKEARKKKSYGSQSSGWWNKRSIYRLVVPLIQRENVTSHLATLHIPLPGYIVHYNSSMLVT